MKSNETPTNEYFITVNKKDEKPTIEELVGFANVSERVKELNLDKGYNLINDFSVYRKYIGPKNSVNWQQESLTSYR